MGAANKDSADAQHAAGAWFEAAALEPLGNGHIHRTYLLRPDGNMNPTLTRRVAVIIISS